MPQLLHQAPLAELVEEPAGVRLRLAAGRHEQVGQWATLDDPKLRSPFEVVDQAVFGLEAEVAVERRSLEIALEEKRRLLGVGGDGGRDADRQ